MPRFWVAAVFISSVLGLVLVPGAGGSVDAAGRGRGLGSAASRAAAVSEQLQGEIDTFEAMKMRDPKNVSVLYSLGMLYQLAGNPREVCDNLHGAYIESEGATPPELLFHLANNLKAIGENDAAINFYFLAITMQPEAPVNWVLASISLDFVGRSKVSPRPAPFACIICIVTLADNVFGSQLAVRGYETVLRLGPSDRIVSWVEIYMLSSLAKVSILPLLEAV